MAYRIPPLRSGGIMLSYRCTNACKHCLYRCGPGRPDEWMSEKKAEEIFSALAEEKSLYGVHLAGGEATMNFEVLEMAIRKAAKYGISIDYLETNVGWCENEETARKGFERLRSAGLGAVLISASLFHNEFTPFKYTRIGIDAAREIFGYGSVLVWTEEVYSLLATLDENKRHTLKESCSLLGLAPADVWKLHSYLTPCGRASEALREGLQTQPAENFAGDSCQQTLLSTGHFHIDPEGRLFTGHCPGITVADSQKGFHTEADAAEYPAYDALCREGPYALIKMCDFRPRKEGYIHKCDLCLDVRKQLMKDKSCKEIGPEEYY